MDDHEDPLHFEAQIALLPFYVNGTLGAKEREFLEAALRQSADLRAELEAEQAIATRIKTGGLAMTTSKPDNEGSRLEGLMEKIGSEVPLAAEPLRVSADIPSPEKVRLLMSYLNPTRWHPAIALTLAVAVMAQGAYIGGQSGRIDTLEKQNFELASGPCAQDGKGSIQMEIKEAASWKDVSGLLDAEGLSIVRSGDFGTLTLGSAKKDAELTAQIERLRKSPLIANAEPAA